MRPARVWGHPKERTKGQGWRLRKGNRNLDRAGVDNRTKGIALVAIVYVISDVTLRNNDAAKAYRELAAASIEQHGGRYVVRGGEITVLEGDWRPQMLVVAEFPSRAAADA